MRGEVDLGKPRWLPKHSAVNVQGLASFDHRKPSRLGLIASDVFLDEFIELEFQGFIG